MYNDNVVYYPYSRRVCVYGILHADKRTIDTRSMRGRLFRVYTLPRFISMAISVNDDACEQKTEGTFGRAQGVPHQTDEEPLLTQD